MRDFRGRCAYSLQHVEIVGSKSMEIDHFNPTLKGSARHEYRNLFPAVHHCNNFKRAIWPTSSEMKAGLRFLNCCEEQDYGVHIFENPDTHELVGITPEGRYHIDGCDLNAPHFVRERRERSQLRDLLEKYAVHVQGEIAEARDLIQKLRQNVGLMIPPVPAPP